MFGRLREHLVHGVALRLKRTPGHQIVASKNLRHTSSSKILLCAEDSRRRPRTASIFVKLTPAPGIGDEAFYVTTPLGTSLLIRKGSTSIGFSVRDKKLPTAQLMADEKPLGLAAAGRL
jgi:hypothetical protein